MMINRESGREFMTHRESLDVAKRDYPEFNREEKEKISALIQRKSYLESCDHPNVSFQRELKALYWVLKEINNFESV